MVSVLRFNEQREKLTRDRAPQEGLAVGGGQVEVEVEAEASPGGGPSPGRERKR